jgi:hypothetical protein
MAARRLVQRKLEEERGQAVVAQANTDIGVLGHAALVLHQSLQSFIGVQVWMHAADGHDPFVPIQVIAVEFQRETLGYQPAGLGKVLKLVDQI